MSQQSPPDVDLTVGERDGIDHRSRKDIELDIDSSTPSQARPDPIDSGVLASRPQSPAEQVLRLLPQLSTEATGIPGNTN
jgi:hypothetical protein